MERKDDRSLSEIATIVEKTIDYISYEMKTTKKENHPELISKSCVAFGISESHIIKVAGWIEEK